MTMSTRWVFRCAVVLACVTQAAAGVTVTVQRRDADGQPTVERITLDAKKTAVVVVDMWDKHWCKTYTRRVANLVPRINATLAAARKLGFTVVHAPSDVLGPYKDAPQRKAMLAVPAAPVPKPSGFNPPGPPGGRDCCECGPDRPCRSGRAWIRQNADLIIAEDDYIGDCNNARELLNLCGHRGIDTLIYMGVASNMCVLYRSFGIRNIKRYGLRAYLVGDLTEAITANGCDPATKKPDANFTPAKGTALVQRYIERHICPTFESRQILRAARAPGSPADLRPHVVFVIAEKEYKTHQTLPAFAKKHLGGEFRCSFVFANPKDPNDLPGLAVLLDADLLVLSVRRRLLPVTQMDHLERYIRAGKPLVALRVSIVPFQVRTENRPPGRVIWDRFDREVLGCNYHGYDAGSRKAGCDVWVEPAAKGHPVLRGVDAKFHSPSWLYRQKPLAKTVQVLMSGRWAQDKPPEPVAWTHTYNGGRVFYTTLGHWDDFKTPAFTRMLVNAVHWALGPR